MKRLQTSLESLRDVLLDAEERRFQIPDIDNWLNELTDVMYNAEDFIDQCRVGGKRLLPSSAPPPSSSSSFVTLVSHCCPSNISSFPQVVGKRITDLNRRLEELSIRKDELQLAPIRPDDRPVRTIRPRTLLTVEADVVGKMMEDETTSLVNLLCESSEKHLLVIWGRGGIGKTTLARKIYHDVRLRAWFHQTPPIWLGASRYQTAAGVLEDLIKCAGGDPSEAKEMEDLALILSQLVGNKRLFLVLDDVRVEKVWVDLVSALESSKSDCRILATTRDGAVAREMKGVHCHRVDELSLEDGWSLICNMVFEDDDDGDQREMQALRDIGMEIVKKCNGIPLALKTIGGVLRSIEGTKSEWEKVLHHPAWSSALLSEEVMRPLYLSYQVLPPRLKQCLAFLSMFPMDSPVQEDEFVSICVAEVLTDAGDGMLLEDTAREYWKELVQRSLLQPDTISHGESVCWMHDLLRSLVRSITQRRSFLGDVEELKASSPSKLRCLSIVDGEADHLPDLVTGQTSLRTLAFYRTPLLGNLPQDLFRSLRRLRMLEVSGTSLDNLPTLIGDLVQLRYLNLSATQIREIPETIKNLRNLRFLILSRCENLHSLDGTSIDELPKGMGGLQHLNKLLGFMVHKNGDGQSRFCTLEELKFLSRLNILTLCKLERVSSRIKARAAALVSMTRLECLHLHCTLPRSSQEEPHMHYGEEDIKRIEKVFEELRPPPCLKVLVIHGYFGCEHPSWMMSLSSLPNLQRLELHSCSLSEQLPAMASLPHLNVIKISGASAVTHIGPEFFLSGGRSDGRWLKELMHRPSDCRELVELVFEDMANWEEWWWLQGRKEDQEASLLPNLEKLTINGCPKLGCLPDGLLHRAPALQVLRIEGAHSLKEIKNLFTVKEMYLHDNQSLERVSDLPSLKVVWFRGCDQLRDVRGLDASDALVLVNPKMESLPDWLMGATKQQFRSLQMLAVTGTADLVKRCLVDCSDWPKIQHIPHVKVNSDDGSAYITKNLSSIKTNIADGSSSRSGELMNE